MKLFPSLFNCEYSRVKLFVFAMNRRRRYSICVFFIYGLEEKNSKSAVIFAVCCLPLTSCLTSLLCPVIFFWLNTLKCISKAPAVDLSTLRGTKIAFLKHRKGITSTPVLFIWEFSPPPLPLSSG